MLLKPVLAEASWKMSKMLILEPRTLQNSQLSGYFAYCYVEQIILFQPNNGQHCLTLLGRLIGKLLGILIGQKQCSVGLYSEYVDITSSQVDSNFAPKAISVI